MAQDDGIVDGQGQLQHHRHRVGDKGDLSEQEVGALVHQGRHAEGHNQHRDFHISLGGKEQYQQDNDHCNQHNHLHLGGQALRGRVAGVAGDIDIVVLQQGLDLPQGLEADLIGGGAIVGDGQQGGTMGVVIRAAVKFHTFDTLYGPNLFGQGVRPVKGDVVYQDPAGAEGDELRIHHGEALAGLCGIGQIAGQIIVDRHPAAGKGAEDGDADVHEVKSLALIHDEGGQALHGALLF